MENRKAGKKMKPQQFSQVLTGGVTYDAITGLPGRIKRLAFKNQAASNINVRFSVNSGNPIVVPAGAMWDSDWCDWQAPVVYVNGTGTLDGEYWG